MMRARALYDCVGDTKEELSFRIGDLITDIKAVEDDGWFSGKLQGLGVAGLFPGNYVRFLEEGEDGDETAAPSIATAARSYTTGAVRSTSANSVSSLGRENAVGGVSVGSAGRFPTVTPSINLRRDLSNNSLSSAVSDTASNSDAGFRSGLRSAAKPADFDSKTTESTASPEAESERRLKKKMEVQATRLAILEKSNAMAKAGRESMIAARKSSYGNVAGTRASEDSEQRYGAGLPRSSSASSGLSVGTDEGSVGSGVAQLRSKFGGMGVTENSNASGPAVPSRPPVVQSNQTYAGPGLPARASPSQIRKSATAPTAAVFTSVMNNQLQSAEADDTTTERLVKPSALRGQPTPFNAALQQRSVSHTLSTSTTAVPTSLEQTPKLRSFTSSAPQLPPSLPNRRPGQEPDPAQQQQQPFALPARPGAGSALGLPKAVDTTGPPIPSRPSTSTTTPPPTRRPAPRPVPPRPTPRPVPPHPTSNTPPIQPDAVQRYTELFHATDTDGDGRVGGEETRGLWLRSGLGNMDLGLIWYVLSFWWMGERKRRRAL
ncbi:uncharacterized protein EV422DRAFT_224527 [Fimicolochytrium jonesii]|uniref:uncharacterized protein n=1 Tax=Fimicolochytrium jonesii TaxID=1396493 RepID=UPI0022FEF3E5|nr:uncharacterized protein EV422DRAFT_224527 [Fimicolochytrium jonesii]KAI8817422.1 hypothetical protein EV422DRAFT_224527 [Fimicolochytrium jonesii]